MANRINIKNIIEAYETIEPEFKNTPQYRSKALEKAIGNKVVVKVETTNPIKSFKGRGASYYISKNLDKSQIVCASAGNLGQAVAYIAYKYNIKPIIFAAKTANQIKIEMMRLLGATVYLEGKDFDEAKEMAREYALNNEMPLIEDSLDVETCEGAGTIGYELMKYSQPLDIVLVALGNGALLTGNARIIKHLSPKTKVIGVVSNNATAMADSFLQKKYIETKNANTIADGIAVRKPIKEVLLDMEGYVDNVLIVDDSIIIEAMKLIHEHLGIVSEPSGAITLAAMLQYRELFNKKLSAVVICGGNLSYNDFEKYF